jgi:hypothetical protein
VDEVHAGWWVKLEGEERDLRELAAHFEEPALEVIQEGSSFWLGSADFVDLTDPETVKGRGRVLLALASGALHVEFGRFDPPRITAAVLVDDRGAKQHFIHVSSSIRLHSEINARIERTRSDGQIEVVELVAPPAQTGEWADLAQRDADVEDVLAVLGREDVRSHDLYHVFEVVQADVGSRMFADGWTTKAAVERFTRTANSRHAIGGEARHGHDRFQPPKSPLSHRDAHDLVLGLVRYWLAEKAPPQPAREGVLEVKPTPERAATLADGARHLVNPLRSASPRGPASAPSS